MKTLSLRKGSIAYIGDKKYEVINAIDLRKALLRDSETGETGTFPIQQLRAAPESGSVKSTRPPVEHIREEHLEEAKRRYEIIKPLIRPDRRRSDVEERAKEFGYCAETVYDWINRYEADGTLSSLAGRYEERGGRGRPRLVDPVEKIMAEVIESFLAKGKRLNPGEIHKEVKIKCVNAKLKAPSENTVRNRINGISKREVMKRTEGSSKAQAIYDPVKGSFDVRHPLDCLQVDETPLDIILVDEVYRKPIGRPFITVAEDIFSRVAYGFCLSFEHPGFFTAGQCLYMGIMPKQEFLRQAGVEGEWDVWGLPKSVAIHTDNAKWYRGKDLKRFSDEYGISVTFRPTKTPKYGGHIERFIETLNMEIHKLPGTTFSNPREKGEYDSEAKAVMTIKEVETWITNFIVKEYHNRPHDGIDKMTPMKKYETGIFGDETTAGPGVPNIIQGEDAIRLKLSLLPSIERTIQRDGVTIENIPYYSDVLRQYAEREKPGSKKRKYFFKRDPRDISIIYFYAPDLKEYSPIPYRNVGWPPMSVWELRKAQKDLKEKNIKDFNEYDIFKAHAERKKIEEEATRKTKAVRRANAAKERHREGMGKTRKHDPEPLSKAAKEGPENVKKAVESRIDNIFSNPKPLEDMEVIGWKKDKEGDAE